MARMKRLPGRSIKYFGWAMQRHQLWLADDYLLCREIAGYRETVTRYYYRDIQAIVTGATSSWRTCNWLTGSLLVFLSGCAIYAAIAGSTTAYVLALAAAAVTLAILLGNLILGPSCTTTLYTAAAEAPLYSLGRRRSTEKAIGRLLPYIEAAQQEPGDSGIAAGPEARITQAAGPRPSDR